MAYSNLEMIETLLLKVSEYEFTEDQINIFIGKADALIDGYLTTVYSVPFATVPALISSISADLSCYYILRTTYTNDRVEEKDSWVIEFYTRAIDLLKKIAKKEIVIEPLQNNSFMSTDENYSPIADVDDPENWVVSQNRLEDIANDRN